MRVVAFVALLASLSQCAPLIAQEEDLFTARQQGLVLLRIAAELLPAVTDLEYELPDVEFIVIDFDLQDTVIEETGPAVDYYRTLCQNYISALEGLGAELPLALNHDFINNSARTARELFVMSEIGRSAIRNTGLGAGGN